MPASNHIVKVALVGAGGHVGKYIAGALVKTGKHQVTAITRPESKSSLPSGIHAIKVDYDDHASLVKALEGQDALLITISVAAQTQQEQLIRAAADANVPWILPNEWGFDSAGGPMIDDLGMSERSKGPRNLIDQLGKSSRIHVSCGFWYEWSLSTANGFGFDFEKKAITLFDEGEARLSVSSWPQVGRAVANLLSLKIHPDGPDDKSPNLEQFKGGWVYPTSFTVSQNDILASVLRVTKTTTDNWTITKESTKERFDNAMQELRNGSGLAFVKTMYTRSFFPDEPTNLERWRGGSHNSILGLEGEEEKLDEYTKIGIERAAEQTAWMNSLHG